MPERRRTFGPVVLVGLAAAALAAVAGSRVWLEGDPGTGAAYRPPATGVLGGPAGESPLAAALALVLLACWGVVLVTRRTFRRAVAILGVATAVTLAATVVAAPWTMGDGVADQVRAHTGSDVVVVGLTGWWWTALLASILVLVTTVVAALLVPHWPEMGSRYDAPAGSRQSSGEESNIDLWKALDEGRDPTAGTTGDTTT